MHCLVQTLYWYFNPGEGRQTSLGLIPRARNKVGHGKNSTASKINQNFKKKKKSLFLRITLHKLRKVYTYNSKVSYLGPIYIHDKNLRRLYITVLNLVLLRPLLANNNNNICLAKQLQLYVIVVQVLRLSVAFVVLFLLTNTPYIVHEVSKKHSFSLVVECKNNSYLGRKSGETGILVGFFS